MQNFDKERYFGKWYEAYRSKVLPYEVKGDCMTAEYSMRTDGYINVYNS